jgi:hypothetical protein
MASGGWKKVLAQETMWWREDGRQFLVDDLDREYALNILLFLYEHHRHRFKPRSNGLIQRLRDRVLS